MTKEAFLEALGEKLSFLPREDAEERLAFYSETIDRRMEKGMAEEDAVAAAGPVSSCLRAVTVIFTGVRLASPWGYFQA